MATNYTCHSPDVIDEPITYEAETPEKAAELYVNENLDFDPTDPACVVEVEVTHDCPEFEGKKASRLIDVTIVLTWTAVAEPR